MTKPLQGHDTEREAVAHTVGTVKPDMAYVVVVGTIANAATEDPETAGTAVWGPFTRAAAHSFAEDVRTVWNKQNVESFTFGDAYCEVQRLNDPTTTIRDAATKAAENWFRSEVEETDIRASALKVGDRYAEYGMDVEVVAKRDDHGDTVLITTESGIEMSIDGDTVVRLNPEED